jgi:hypothetical protein
MNPQMINDREQERDKMATPHEDGPYIRIDLLFPNFVIDSG